MSLGRRVAHKICVSALELAKTLVSKEALKSFQRGVGFLIRWQVNPKAPNCVWKDDLTEGRYAQLDTERDLAVARMV